MSEYVKTAVSLVIKILQNDGNPTSDALYEILENEIKNIGLN